MSYFNTTRLRGADLVRAIADAAKQEDAVLAIYANATGPLSPSDVWGQCNAAGKHWPLTSIRRAITDLTEAGKLIQMDEQKTGIYRRPEHLWSHLPDGMQKALAALHGPSAPMTNTERAEFDAARQREMARAEARRNQTPQADLFEATA